MRGDSVRAVAFGAVVLAMAGCGRDLDGPAPDVGAIEPGLVCVEQLTTEVVVTGDGFSPLPVDTLADDTRLELPDVTLLRTQDLSGAAAMEPIVEVPDDPADPESSQVRWTSQQELAFTVDPALSLEPGLYDIRITNRNGNEDTLVPGLLGVPRPTLDRIEPDLLCGDKDNAFMLVGDHFLRLADGSEPTVTISDGTNTVTYPATTGGCRELPGPSGTQACTNAQITIPAGDLDPGNYEVVLTNPEPANCASTDPQTLTIVPKPTLTEVEPDLACVADHAVTLTLRGSDFLEVDGTPPTVTIGDNTYDSMVVDASCTDLDVMREAVRSCTELTVTVPEGDFDAGVYDVTVTNPPPADCSSTDDVSWTVVDAPTVVSIEPQNLCSDGSTDTTFTITGTGFLFVDGNGPAVSIGDMMYEGVAVTDSCVEISGVSSDVQQCTRMTVTVPAGTYTPGTYTVVVTNPEPAGCSSSADVTLNIVPPPDVTSVAPTRICSGGGTLTITGTDFAPGATVTLDGMPAAMSTVDSSTQITATFGTGWEVGGPYDLVVSNAPGCDDTLSGVVTVITGPQIFFADPPVVYNGINTQVTLYVTGVTSTVDSVEIQPSGGGAATTVTHTWSPSRPNRVQIIVPSGTDPGTYDILLDDGSECTALLPMGLEVTEDLTVSVTAVDPPFGWTSSDTAVTVLGEDPPPAGFVGFQPVPRMYLNPAVPSAGTVATPIEAVSLLASWKATAIVPEGLPVDTYDLIVVNPDGSVGLLEDAFDVTADPPPVIETISPGTVTNSSSESFDVIGQDFRTPDVSLRCQPRGGGAVTTVDPTESGASATQVTATFDASGFTEGAVCVVRVTSSDGTYGEFSALTITNPAQNLGDFVASTDMVTARRALASASAPATRAARFVYAIGGDDGTTGGAMSTVESAPIDIFGFPGDFTQQRYELTTARTFAGAVRIGRFLYVVGGNDGSTQLASIERAYVLDPVDRPEITDLEIQVIASGGLDTGVWYYRVAAIMDASDPYNPDGESLASERFPVILPDLTTRGLQVILNWSEVSGAVGYRIYRSPMADDPAGSERLIAEVTGGTTLTYTDTGDTAMTLAPLDIGATGKWHTVATLSTARQGAGVTAIEDFDTPGTWYVYAAGGRGASGNLDSIEVLPVTVEADDSHTLGTLFTATASLSMARWQVGIYAVDNGNSYRISDTEPWLYVVGGTTMAAGGTAVQDADAFPIQDDGDLGTLVSVDRLAPASAGFGHAPANNFLHVFGGNGGMASNQVLSAEICGSDRPCVAGALNPPDPPDLVNWNNAGVTLNVARVHMGTSTLPGFIYVLGGYNGTSATATTEWTNW